MAMPFEWDEEKAKINLKKHKVGFEEAKSVFGDPFTITIDDPEHSKEEQRFIDIGKSVNGKLLWTNHLDFAQQNPNLRLCQQF